MQRAPGGPARLDRVCDVLSGLSVCVIAVLIVWQSTSGPGTPQRPPRRQVVRQSAPPALPERPVPLDGGEVRGSTQAAVAMIVFSDFQCPFSAQFALRTLPLLEERYVSAGRLLIAFRHLPLQTLHSSAFHAAEGATCAAFQGHFWEMHDELFFTQRKLDEASLRRRAARLDLDPVAFATCLTRGEAAAKVRGDAVMAHDLGISGTPTFLIGLRQADGTVKVMRRLSGSLPFERLEDAIKKIEETGRELASAALNGPG